MIKEFHSGFLDFVHVLSHLVSFLNVYEYRRKGWVSEWLKRQSGNCADIQEKSWGGCLEHFVAARSCNYTEVRPGPVSWLWLCFYSIFAIFFLVINVMGSLQAWGKKRRSLVVCGKFARYLICVELFTGVQWFIGVTRQLSFICIIHIALARTSELFWFKYRRFLNSVLFTVNLCICPQEPYQF